MISCIVCSRRGPAWDYHRRNVDKTVGAACEYVQIDNSDSARGICAAYNEGADRSRGEVLVFVHEDVFFMEPGWGRALGRLFADRSVGLVGVAGTQYLFADDLRWHVAGPPFTRGRVVHELDQGQTRILTVFCWDKSDAEVVAVDGLFFAIRRELFGGIRFDQELFDGFHFYDLDISMQVRRTHRCVVTWDILLKHLSAGRHDPSWFAAAERFRGKYAAELPATCALSAPDRSRLSKPYNYDIRDRVQQATIV